MANKIQVEYSQVQLPIKRLTVEDIDCENFLVIQKSKSVKRAITMYISRVPNSRVRVYPEDAKDLAHELIEFADQILRSE